jgi:Putative auto-transporter adhesin, head GIN domain
MPSRKLILITVALGALAACAHAEAATHSYSVSSFQRIRVEGPFDVKVHVGGAPGVRATGSQQMIDRLSVEQHDDALVIKPLPGGWGGWPGADHGKLIVEVDTPSLAAAGLAGSGNLSIDRVTGDRLDLTLAGSGDLVVAAIEVTQLRAVMTGSGDLTIAGRARQASATLTGSGDLHGDKLVADDATTSLIGSGDLALGAQHTAKAMLAGSGNITIVGPAACTINRSGSGDVSCAHQTAGN